ncbi:MAG TPA: sigma-54 dependent transcriptional regulator [Methylomirabilota bacterium]|nr:sigma-54 dependent transcriptional regulator [Methylomirabilota bacterium]
MTTETFKKSRVVRPVVLIVDDELGVRESFKLVLEDSCDILEAEDGPQAIELARTSGVHLVLLDIRLPGMDGIEVLERIKAIDDEIEVILVTAVKTIRTAVDAIKLGAFDYITKPFDLEEITSLVHRALEKRALQREVLYLRGELAERHGLEQIVGRSLEMLKLYQLIAHVAETTATVLITGESGTGKELIARAIHKKGPRSDKPFVAVNCAAIPPTLIESELFGHEKGAFTGAYQKKLGKFELAQGGTLFLDEVGNLRLDLQAKLLRALQEREVERVGGTRTVKVDLRLVAATNMNLKRAVQDRTFREDLYYRLNVVPIQVPPLRERPDDVPLLVDSFIKKYNREFGKAVKGVTRSALAMLTSYEWPGNVRELENIIERSIALSRGPLIRLRDLPLDLAISDGSQSDEEEKGLTLRAARRQFERQFILRVLERVDWNQSMAARLLGLHRNGLFQKLVGLGIKRELPDEPQSQEPHVAAHP